MESVDRKHMTLYKEAGTTFFEPRVDHVLISHPSKSVYRDIATKATNAINVMAMM